MNSTKKETEAIFNLPPPKPKEEKKEDVPMESTEGDKSATQNNTTAEGDAPPKDQADAEMTNEEGENK